MESLLLKFGFITILNTKNKSFNILYRKALINIQFFNYLQNVYKGENENFINIL